MCLNKYGKKIAEINAKRAFNKNNSVFLKLN